MLTHSENIPLSIKQAVTLSDFEEHVEAILRRHKEQHNSGKQGDIKFFLSTNDADTEAYMLRKYPAHMLIFPKAHHSERDSLVGIREALADWLLLGRCALIIGSFWSSFSDEAAVMNRPLKIMVRNGLDLVDPMWTVPGCGAGGHPTFNNKQGLIQFNDVTECTVLSERWGIAPVYVANLCGNHYN